MTRPTQGSGGPDGRPRCYNGEPMLSYAANYRPLYTGMDSKNGLFESVQEVRVIPWAFSTECKSWASDPSTDPVPMAEGWRCDGCRRYPAELVKLAEKRRQERLTRERERGSSSR